MSAGWSILIVGLLALMVYSRIFLRVAGAVVLFALLACVIVFVAGRASNCPNTVAFSLEECR